MSGANKEPSGSCGRKFTMAILDEGIIEAFNNHVPVDTDTS